MLPQLVLNEDEKKRRFKKFLSNKDGEGSNLVEDHQYSDDDSMHQRVTDMPPLEPIPLNFQEKFLSPVHFNHQHPLPCTTPPCTAQST